MWGGEGGSARIGQPSPKRGGWFLLSLGSVRLSCVCSLLLVFCRDVFPTLLVYTCLSFVTWTENSQNNTTYDVNQVDDVGADIRYVVCSQKNSMEVGMSLDFSVVGYLLPEKNHQS